MNLPLPYMLLRTLHVMISTIGQKERCGRNHVRRLQCEKTCVVLQYAHLIWYVLW